jgi:YVTN family beta-propeller protein
MRHAQRAAILFTAAAGLLAAVTTAASASTPATTAPDAAITVTATIPVGNTPTGIAVNQRTNTVYVTNEIGGTVSVIDGRTDTVTTTIPVGFDWGAPRLPDSPSIRMDVWKGEVIASTEEELLSRIPG